MRLMPLMLVAYMLQFLDKITLGNASVMGIMTDLKLTGSQYSWASSIFYFGYLVASYPASICLTKLPLAKFLSICIIIWAVILILHCVARNFAGLKVLRCLLGVLECVISPGFSMIVGVWYKQSEHASRHGAWFVGNAAGSIVGAFISYGVARIDSFSSWKVLFILEAFVDPKTWLFFTYSLLVCFGNGALTAFGNIIIKGFGFKTLQTLLLNMPSAVLLKILIPLTGWLSSKLPRSRCWLAITLLLLGTVGAIMVRQINSSQHIARLFGFYFFGQMTGAMPLVLSMIASNVKGQTKKTATSALFFIGYCVGNIAGPQVFLAREAPHYPTAFACMIACMALSVGAMLALRLNMSRENKRRDANYGKPSETALQSQDGDLTDFQQEKTFRYMY
ncbi:hypothetical protein NKR23_g677 [Pleurostoma richardsiae]|uniref:Major facilitator superfamily (MFS) profile domain-containing protein n=1 Tax=Pleurostoma richardsiae TaxID=41990 RepID=A0AA38RV76_9PEZI|nr:hypothetical protein NKR23_g677 [Pleurostoma richardsiae]